ncbi:MAG: tRNA lysidine(34) synthetase TilS [Bacteroidia bacterium]|nr:tRNA lysidine(34) synthetase TilS [Bacteroidia bacterium]
MNLLKEFQEHIEKEQLFLPQNKLLLAVSGGLDSMVLFTLLQLIKQPFEVAHVNFKLRGLESDEDANFIKEHCKLHHIPFHETQFNTQLYVQASGLGIQEAARKLRYQWFFQLMELHQFHFLLTAHHANDQAETVLFHLMRGAGVKGLAGMIEKKNKIIRPLLFATKQQLTNFATQNNLTFRQDSSNEKDTYSRNFIRHHILPKIAQIQPNFVEGIEHHSRLMQHTWHYYQEQMETVKKDILVQTEKDTLQISIPKISVLAFADMVLFYIVQEFGFNHSQCLQLLQAAKEGSTGAQFYSDTHKILVNRDTILVKILEKEIDIHTITNLPIKLTLGNMEYVFEQSNFTRFEPNTWWLDLDTLQFPIVIRKVENGDKFIPLGLSHSQKVSDYFINKKIDRFTKDQSWVMLSNNKICFLGAHQISNENKLLEQTKNFLKITKLTK